MKNVNYWLVIFLAENFWKNENIHEWKLVRNIGQFVNIQGVKIYEKISKCYYNMGACFLQN